MWIETIVMPREETAHFRPAPQRDRAAAHAAGHADSQQFRESVLSYLKSNQLMNAVKWVSEPGSIAMVTLHCTSGVLEHLQNEPSFEAGRSLSCTVY
jgi:hypothetical protein